MTHHLTSGKYIISNLAAHGQFIGRNEAHENLPVPKKVVNLPRGVRAPKWILEEVEKDHFIVKIDNDRAGAVDHLVFAFPPFEPIFEVWVITPRPHIGPEVGDVYTIERKSREEGWVLPEVGGGDVQVACRPLITLPGDPPHFPPTELWVIRRSEEDD